MSSIVEHMRSIHELSETAEAAVSEEMNDEVLGQKSAVYQQHAIRSHIDKAVTLNRELEMLYEDKDGLLKEEIANMRKDGGLDSFYEMLGKNEEYHKRNPNAMMEQVTPSALSLQHRKEINVEFSGEEVFGKYLDLHAQYTLYCNLPFVALEGDKDYIEFLDTFLNFGKIDEKEKEKEKKSYGPYLRSLHDYFVGYIARVQPLVDLDHLLEEWSKEFDSLWAEDKVFGWRNGGGGGADSAFDLDSFESQASLEALGADQLKAALEGMGLKCGGTLADRAKRLWSVKGLVSAEIPAKLKAKGAAVGKVGEAAGSGGGGRKRLALTEHLITRLTTAINEVIRSTRRHAEKQQTRSTIEKQREYEEEESGMPVIDIAGGGGGDGSDGDDDSPVHNPLKLPLGWDGKPIPFWMYRLHGLNEKFPCEICGNEVYMGRRNFDKHFSEAKHVANLRAIGIPNSRHFQGVTKIADAQALYTKMQAEMAISQSRDAEQFEDAEGNVLDRATFEARARMGQL